MMSLMDLQSIEISGTMTLVVVAGETTSLSFTQTDQKIPSLKMESYTFKLLEKTMVIDNTHLQE